MAEAKVGDLLELILGLYKIALSAVRVFCKSFKKNGTVDIIYYVLHF